MFQPHFCSGNRDVLGLERIDSAWHACFDVAKGAGARANIAQYHHRCMLFRPAFANIWARGFFANGIKLQVTHQLSSFVETRARGRLYPDPVGLALTGGSSDRRGVIHARPLGVSHPACHPAFR
jgi:hypothetical protein